MAKDKGILLDPETGDLQISTGRDALGIIGQGLVIGNTTYQNQAVILQALKGELKEYPVMGVGISDMVCDNEATGWKREIALQLELDGMAVNDVEIDLNNSKLTIDAEYSS